MSSVDYPAIKEKDGGPSNSSGHHVDHIMLLGLEGGDADQQREETADVSGERPILPNGQVNHSGYRYVH